jgi:streptomycin 6-kinase
MATEIAQTLRPRQNALDSPVPARWVGQATRLAAELAADAGANMVHADLHYGNILAGTRQPWLAIDPKAIAGDPNGFTSDPVRCHRLLDALAR